MCCAGTLYVPVARGSGGMPPREIFLKVIVVDLIVLLVTILILLVFVIFFFFKMDPPRHILAHSQPNICNINFLYE